MERKFVLWDVREKWRERHEGIRFYLRLKRRLLIEYLETRRKILLAVCVGSNFSLRIFIVNMLLVL